MTSRDHKTSSFRYYAQAQGWERPDEDRQPTPIQPTVLSQAVTHFQPTHQPLPDVYECGPSVHPDPDPEPAQPELSAVSPVVYHEDSHAADDPYFEMGTTPIEHASQLYPSSVDDLITQRRSQRAPLCDRPKPGTAKPAKNDKPAPAQPSKCSRFMCRLSNPDDYDFQQLSLFSKRPEVTYFVCGEVETHSYDRNASEWREAEPTTPHCHFYFEVNKLCRYTAFVKKIGVSPLKPGTEIQNAREPSEKCRAYCLKDQAPAIEVGQLDEGASISRITYRASVLPQENQKKKDALQEALDECNTRAEFVLKYPKLYVRNCHGVDKFYQDKLNRQESVYKKVVTEWHFGDTRSGKTHTCLEAVGGPDNWQHVHYMAGDLSWISGKYAGQETLMINEFRKGDMRSFQNLLHILEGFPCELAVKGDFTKMFAKKVYITCPFPPKGRTFIIDRYCEQTGRTEFPQVRGAFDYVEKYGQDAGNYHEGENVDQIIERIRENGGKLVFHWRYWTANGWAYDSEDVIDQYPAHE